MLSCTLQSEAQSVTEGDMGEEEDEDTEEGDEEDGLKGDTVWDPDHATPWRPRRSRRNTSQLTARQPSRLLPEKVCPDRRNSDLIVISSSMAASGGRVVDGGLGGGLHAGLSMA